MVEQTLIFLKPDAVRNRLTGRIISRFEDRGFKIRGMRMLTLTSELSDKYYAEHIDKPFYPGLKDYVMSGPIVAVVLEAENAVSVVRRMVGDTDAGLAQPGTIRGDFALLKSENGIHASDSPESAQREIANFFESLV